MLFIIDPKFDNKKSAFAGEKSFFTVICECVAFHNDVADGNLSPEPGSLFD